MEWGRKNARWKDEKGKGRGMDGKGNSEGEEGYAPREIRICLLLNSHLATPLIIA
jgi:hypothetical protein